MHNHHFILVKADSAAEAASTVESELLEWGNDNNWRTIGGIASEDGSDDVENHEGAGWPLSFLDGEEDVPKEGTYFSRAVAYVRHSITEPISLIYMPDLAYPDLRSAFKALSNSLRDFNPDTGSSHELWVIGHNLDHLSKLLDSRAAIEAGTDIPEFYEWQFDQVGLTDLTSQSEGSKRYLVFLDMHS